jgi:hypothetical protein
VSNKRKAAAPGKAVFDPSSVRPIAEGYVLEALQRISRQEERMAVDYAGTTEPSWERQTEIALARLEGWCGIGGQYATETPPDGVEWNDWIESRLARVEAVEVVHELDGDGEIAGFRLAPE